MCERASVKKKRGDCSPLPLSHEILRAPSVLPFYRVPLSRGKPCLVNPWFALRRPAKRRRPAGPRDAYPDLTSLSLAVFPYGSVSSGAFPAFFSRGRSASFRSPRRPVPVGWNRSGTTVCSSAAGKRQPHHSEIPMWKSRKCGNWSGAKIWRHREPCAVAWFRIGSEEVGPYEHLPINLRTRHFQLLLPVSGDSQSVVPPNSTSSSRCRYISIAVTSHQTFIGVRGHAHDRFVRIHRNWKHSWGTQRD